MSEENNNFLTTFYSEAIDFEVLIEKECENLVLNINSSKISQVFLNLFKNSLDDK